MIDRIIKGNGKSNKVRFDLQGVNSFTEFKSKSENGTLSADVLADNSGVGTDNNGTPLKKSTLLTNDTEVLLGFDPSQGSATINDALERLATSVPISVQSINGFRIIKYSDGYMEATKTASQSFNFNAVWGANDRIFGCTPRDAEDLSGLGFDFSKPFDLPLVSAKANANTPVWSVASEVIVNTKKVRLTFASFLSSGWQVCEYTISIKGWWK